MMRGSLAARSAGGRVVSAASASTGARAALAAPASGAPLIRLLARLAQADIAEPGSAFADRLSQWLGWTDAIALSSVLGAPMPAAPAASVPARGTDAAFARQRDALVRALRDDAPRESHPGDRARAARGTPPRIEPTQAPADFPSERRRYLAKQQAMEAGVAALREGLRAALAARSPDLAKLAAVDAVMERVLGERERELLSLVPVVLAQRFEQLRQAELAARAARAVDEGVPGADAEPAAEPASPDAAVPSATLSGAWLAAFRRDLHELLQAELDLRLQPVEGLIDALASTGSRT